MAFQAKISGKSKKIVQEIARETGESQVEVIEDALVVYQREWRMHQVNKDYARLKKNKRAWKEELGERSLLEQTAEDGLEDV